MTRRSTSDDAARDARDDDDDANFPNEAYARDISLETGESRSGTPPIPPLPPAEYEAMIRAQRAVGRAMRTTGAGTDSDSGIGRLDVSAAARVSERTNDGDEDDDADEDADDAFVRVSSFVWLVVSRREGVLLFVIINLRRLQPERRVPQHGPRELRETRVVVVVVLLDDVGA